MPIQGGPDRDSASASTVLVTALIVLVVFGVITAGVGQRFSADKWAYNESAGELSDINKGSTDYVGAVSSTAGSDANNSSTAESTANESVSDVAVESGGGDTADTDDGDEGTVRDEETDDGDDEDDDERRRRERRR